MDITTHDLAPGENPSQLGVISRPFSPQLRAEPTGAIAKIRDAYYAYLAEALFYEIVGVDVSVWQGRINWEISKLLVDFAIIRAGHGSSADTQLDNNRTGCDKYEIPFGLYWYFVPSLGWLSQARTYAAIYNDNPGKLTPVLDVEQSDNFSRADLSTAVRKFLEEFEVRTKQKMMIYTSASFWNTYIGRTTWARLYKLWVANYTAAGQPYMPADWTKWTMWQWSSKGDGAKFGAQSRYIDLDRYYGTKTQFEQEFNIAQHDVFIPVVIGMQVAASATPYLNIRTGPSSSYQAVGRLLPGDKFEAKDFGGINAWAQINGGQYDGGWVCVQENTKHYCEVDQQAKLIKTPQELTR